MASRRVDIRDWPRLTRFYGIGPMELARLPHVVVSMYAEQLMELLAEETILGFTTSDMPYAKPGDRRKVFAAWERLIDKPDPVKLDVRTEEGAAVATAQFGIKVDIPQAEVKSEQDA